VLTVIYSNKVNKRHALKICNTYWFYMAIIVTRRHVNMTLYKHACLVTFSVWQIINITHHELGLGSPASSLSNSLLKDLSSHLRPFGLKFSIILSSLLLFILVIFRSQFHLHFLSFSSTGTTYNSSKISSFILWSKKGVPGCSEKLHLDWHKPSFIIFSKFQNFDSI